METLTPLVAELSSHDDHKPQSDSNLSASVAGLSIHNDQIPHKSIHSIPPPATPNPVVLLMSIFQHPYNQLWSDQTRILFLSLLSSLATIKEVTTPYDAMNILESQDEHPSAIILTAPGINETGKVAEYVYRQIVLMLKPYVSRGGRVVFCCMYRAWMDFPRMKQFWADCFTPALTWEPVFRTNTTMYLNNQTGVLGTSLRPKSSLQAYTCPKALFVSGLRVGDCVYLPGDFSMARTDSCVVFTDFGDGKVGFIGDMAPGMEILKVLLTMCGLDIADLPREN